MHTMFAVPFCVNWCCLVLVSESTDPTPPLPPAHPARTSFFIGIRKTLRGVRQVPGIWGQGIRLDWAGLSLVLPGSRYSLGHCQEGGLQLVSQILAIGKEARNQNSKNPLWLPVPWEKNQNFSSWKALPTLPSISSFEPIWPSFRSSGGQTFSPLELLLIPFLPPEWHQGFLLWLASLHPFRSQCHHFSEAFPN